MCKEGDRPWHGSSASGILSDLALSMSSIWLFLSHILYHKTEIVSKVFLSSVSFQHITETGRIIGTPPQFIVSWSEWQVALRLVAGI